MLEAGVPIIPGTTDPGRIGRRAARARRGDRLPAPDQGGGGRRWKGMEASTCRTTREEGLRAGATAGASRTSRTGTSTSRSSSSTRVTSRCRCSPMPTATSSHLGERDCTIQRRHQKLGRGDVRHRRVDEELRAADRRDRRRGGTMPCGYRPPGTIEGLLYARRRLLLHGDEHAHPGRAHRHRDGDGPRPRTREILVALGEPLSLRQRRMWSSRGHAIECRINAEDVARGFLPAPARVTGYREPSGPGVRVDSGVAAGYEVSGADDPMVAKLIVHGVDLRGAGGGCCGRRRIWIEGPTTLIGFHKASSRIPASSRARPATGAVESEEPAACTVELDGTAVPAAPPSNSRLPGTDPDRMVERVRTVEVDRGGGSRCGLSEPEPGWRALARRRRERVRESGSGAGGRRRRLADAGHRPRGARGRR